MTYRLAFVESALKEWRKLAAPNRDQFKLKLAERLDHPRVPKARLHNLPDCYKIKLRRVGYRLVYQVDDKIVLVTVIAVGKRDENRAGREAGRRTMYFGAEHRNRDAAKRQRLESALRNFVVIPYDHEIARCYGRLTAERKHSGRQIAPNDAWIAACAMRHGIPVVTHNVKDFDGITALRVITAQPP